MKKFSIFFGKLPLCGKYGIRSWMASVINSENREERIKNCITCILCLILFILLHAKQFCMGCELILSSVGAIATCVGICYAVINLGACVEQIYLIYRTINFTVRSRGKYRTTENCHSLNHDSDGKQLIAIACTLLGQIIFVSIYVHAKLL